MNKKYFNKGFTLVELIISVALLIIIIAGLTPMLARSIRYFSDINTQMSYQRTATNIINSIRSNVGNSRAASLYNAKADASNEAKYAKYVSEADYSEFKLVESDGKEISIVSSSDIGGKKIKVDFECSNQVRTAAVADLDDKLNPTDTRLAMLYVTISIYDAEQDLSIFDTYPENYLYWEYDPLNADATNNYVIKKYVNSVGDEITMPQPLFQDTTGIYLINLRQDMGVPSSRRTAIEALVDKTNNSGTSKFVNASGTPYNPSNDADKANFALAVSNFNKLLARNDQATAADLGLDALAIDTSALDYTGSVLKFYKVSEDI